MPEITKSEQVIQEALKDFAVGDYERGKQKLKKQADRMLMLAIMSGDAVFREVAALLYQKMETVDDGTSA